MTNFMKHPGDTYVYTKIDDPGHGWLIVPTAELKELGILDKISPFSYTAPDYHFLEEDSDMGVFLDAMKAKRFIVKVNHRHVDDFDEYLKSRKYRWEA